MGRINSVFKLPVELRQKLNTQLRDNNFSDYVYLESWLKDEGFFVSKSAIFRYAQSNRLEILGLNEDEGYESSLPDMRARCLESAIAINHDGDIESVLKDADRFLKWIYLG
ncbi:phage protein Gp27 family protein [Limnobaculum xujianqingii]|uniref:phage protein Gp27 family protein n=1 Tax=Limnobaculum xujianqingii TaxID=2738837 RepID=UPI00112792B9|nr:phage protein Gp27 family protein [Limnobaculum xujianqingii]